MNYERTERAIRLVALAVLVEFVVLGLAMAFGAI